MKDQTPCSDYIETSGIISFIIKRGWRDEGAPGLIIEKELNGFGNRDDIQTYVDLHDADEGRTPRYAEGSAQAFVPKP